MRQNMSRRAILAGLGLCLLTAPRASTSAQERTPFLDVHVHPARGLRHGENLESAAALALHQMDRFGIERAILVPPPFPPGNNRAYGLSDLGAVTRGQTRLAFTAGGDSLNPMLQETPADRVPADLLRRFTETADGIAAAGAAGFGELAAEHFSAARGHHPYESSPPDHPLLLALADIAAKHGMPIELHMEAVPEDMPFPSDLPKGPNPDRLTANIARFERLLNHNPTARIVWHHAGWDLTGKRTVMLMRGLLERHSNLSMSIKYDGKGNQLTAPFSPSGGDIRPDWIAMLHAFPDRFVVGSDQFVGEETERFEGARRLVDALPTDLVHLVASENAKRIYRLTPS